MRALTLDVFYRERTRSSLLAATWLLVLAPLLLLSAPARGGEGRYLSDERTFTAYIAQLVTRAMPAGKVTVKEPLTLTIDGQASGLVQINLDSLYSYCRRAPEDCDRQAETYVGRASDLFHRMAKPLERSDLRAIVRDNAYVEGFRKLYNGQGEPVAEGLVGDLWVLCVVDMPGSMQILSSAQLPELKLSSNEALALCKKNSAATLPSLAPAKRDYPWAGVNIVTGDPYDAGWLIFPERWTGIAESLQGDLLVAAPGVDILLYASGAAPDSVAALGRAAALVAAKAQKPLSTAVFRWTPTGWEETKP